MEDLEEQQYVVTEDYKEDKDIPIKESTTQEDAANEKQVAKAKTNKHICKEMKKTKAHMHRVTKDFLRRLVINTATPYEV